MARKAPIAAAMKMSRHAGYRSAQRYIHVNEDDLEDAYTKLEEGARRGPRQSAARKSTLNVGAGTVTSE
jgi:hypothetical protein